jgi:hypothetical protein
LPFGIDPLLVAPLELEVEVEVEPEPPPVAPVLLVLELPPPLPVLLAPVPVAPPLDPQAADRSRTHARPAMIFVSWELVKRGKQGMGSSLRSG